MPQLIALVGMPKRGTSNPVLLEWGTRGAVRVTINTLQTASKTGHQPERFLRAGAQSEPNLKIKSELHYG